MKYVTSLTISAQYTRRNAFCLNRDRCRFKPLSPYPKIFSNVPFERKSPPLSDYTMNSNLRVTENQQRPYNGRFSGIILRIPMFITLSHDPYN